MFVNEPSNIKLASFGSSYIDVLASNDNVSKLLELMKDKNFSIQEISKQDYLGNTPMHYAALSSSYKIARLLMTLLIFNNHHKNNFHSCFINNHVNYVSQYNIMFI